MQLFPTAGTFTSNVALVAEYSRATEFSSCMRFKKDLVFDCDDNCAGTSKIVTGDNAGAAWDLNDANDLTLAHTSIVLSST